ncbi:MAG: transposase [Bacteroidales bacterium]|nr:transposase [Bacteroidales bacterium]
MKKIYLLSTSHLEKMLWFLDDEDFKVAMNYVAILAAKRPEVVVLAFVLMSNHVHFVLRGTRKDVIAFVNEFKRCYSIYYRKRNGASEFLRGNSLDVREVESVKEALERALAYVIDNPVVANICSHPSQYEWGTGNLYFNSSVKCAKTVGDLSRRERIRIFHSASSSIPKDWGIDDRGVILPVNYVDVSMVEKLFKTPVRMNYFIVNSSKAKNKYESGNNILSIRDQTVFSCIKDMCWSLFQKPSFEQLNPKEKSEFAKQLRFRFNSDANQIARVCGVSYSDAARLLDECSV